MGLSGLFSWLGSGSKIFETYLCRQSTLVLGVRSYLFIFNLVTFRASFARFLGLSGQFFWPFESFSWVGIRFEIVLEHTNVDNQYLLGKCNPIFLLSIWRNLGPFLHFLGPSELFLWVRVKFKTVFGTYLSKQSTLILEVPPYLLVFIGHIWGLFSPFFALWGCFIWLFGAINVVGVMFENIFETYLCRQSTLVLEGQPYLFVFNSAKFGAIFALFGPFGAFLGGLGQA